MGLFDKLFGSSNRIQQPNIQFGRYSDSHKESEKYEYWEKSLKKFDEKEYLQAYQDFFSYLKDEQEANVRCWLEGTQLHFELFQGSKKITGIANQKQVKAEARVAKANELKENFMKRLLAQNHDLQYSRFALDEDNHIIISFDTYTLDGSPYKLYYALKELASQADKMDDLLIDEFDCLSAIETGHIRELPELEKKIKHAYIVKEIQKAVDTIDNSKLNFNQYPGAAAYIWLHLNYKLDFLTRPEGFMMEALERAHRLYFAKDDKSTLKKNEILRNEFIELLQRPANEYFKEMYSVTTTFGITSPVSHDRVIAFIDGELDNMDWYYDNGYHDVALAIPGYIVGFCLFNYAVPKPDKDYFLLFYEITESAYFKTLGFSPQYYNPSTKTFDRKGIKRRIKQIAEKNSKQFVELHPDTSYLVYSSLASFAKSYLQMIRALNTFSKLD